VLEITVWKEPELSRSVVVRPEGTINLSLVGDVRVVGLTPQRLMELITEKLKPFIRLPKVTVTVLEIGAKQPSDPRKWLPPKRPRQLPPLWPFCCHRESGSAKTLRQDVTSAGKRERFSLLRPNILCPEGVKIERWPNPPGFSLLAAANRT
jgi:hypothetical protein